MNDTLSVILKLVKAVIEVLIGIFDRNKAKKRYHNWRRGYVERRDKRADRAALRESVDALLRKKNTEDDVDGT